MYTILTLSACVYESHMTLQITIVDSELYNNAYFPNKETWLLSVPLISIEIVNLLISVLMKDPNDFL